MSTAGAKVPLGELPTPSTAITQGIDQEMTGGALTLRFAFFRDGLIYRSGVRFEKVRASRWRAESHCTVWHIEAYDTIMEVTDSAWVEELSMAEPARQWGNWVMRHFMLYTHSSGCIEVVAENWALLPVELAS
jgi:hypothetical protein